MKDFQQYIKSEGILHDILGVQPGASQEEVKKAYKEKAPEKSGDDLANLKYARKILLRKREEYEAAGDPKWFGDRRHRRVERPFKMPTEKAAQRLVKALRQAGWILQDAGMEDGDAWAAAYHHSIEELGDPDGVVLFRISSKKPELVVYYDAMKTGKYDIKNPPGNPVLINIEREDEKPGYSLKRLGDAVKSVVGRASSEVYNARRRKLGRYFIPENE